MAIKSECDCIKKALPDEQLFTLMARDETAPSVIMYWIEKNLSNQPKERLLEAFNCALAMTEQHQAIRNTINSNKSTRGNLTPSFFLGSDIGLLECQHCSAIGCVSFHTNDINAD